MKSVGISLGWNCSSAVWAVENKIRVRKEDGYKTCPFDIMISNYKGIVQCINDDFEFFLDDRFLTIIDELDPGNPVKPDPTIYNTRYNFAFNHESPGHANLYIKENWSEGINHFVNNSFLHFKERYSRRIQNFRDYLSNPLTNVTFILSSWEKHDTSELREALARRYPHLKYKIIIRNEENGKEHYLRHMTFMKYTEEIERLSNS